MSKRDPNRGRGNRLNFGRAVAANINFDLPMARRLRAVYDRELERGLKRDDVFHFDDRDWVVGYAYYVLEYLADQFQEPILKPESRPEE